jgi:hypothetical protein
VGSSDFPQTKRLSQGSPENVKAFEGYPAAKLAQAPRPDDRDLELPAKLDAAPNRGVRGARGPVALELHGPRHVSLEGVGVCSGALGVAHGVYLFTETRRVLASTYSKL